MTFSTSSRTIRPDGSVLDRIGGTGRARDNTAARLALAKAQADAEFKLLKDALERQGRALDQALSDRLLSIRDYCAAKTAAFVGAVDAGVDWMPAVQAAWTDADQALWAGVLNFWFLGRVFDRVRP